MSWLSYEFGRQDGVQEERNRNSGGGCVVCFWAMVAILTPLGVVGYFRWAWKQLLHVEPPVFAEVTVGALVVIALLAIAVDEYRKKSRHQSPRLVGKFSLPRIFVISFVGGALVSALIVAIQLAGLGVNSRPAAVAAPHRHSTLPHRSKQKALHPAALSPELHPGDVDRTSHPSNDSPWTLD